MFFGTAAAVQGAFSSGGWCWDSAEARLKVGQQNKLRFRVGEGHLHHDVTVGSVII